MNKGVLKSFALWGRKKLGEELLEAAELRGCQLEEKELYKNTYLWFMRFVIIRFADLKGFLPRQCRYFSADYKKSCSDSLSNSIVYLSTILPNIFNAKEVDFTQILCELQGKVDSFIEGFVSEVMDEEFEEVEIIGWFHQFFLSEEHDNIVGMNNGTIKSEHVPAATQLFTPKWIVKYMVDNSLGKLWLEREGNSCFIDKLEFYIEAKVKDNRGDKPKKLYEALKPETIRFFDPACGCGHILVYAFDIFYEIYKSCGYGLEDIPLLIIENNLYGLDIDESAVIIAEAVLMLKARERNSNFFDRLAAKPLSFNILSVKNSRELMSYRHILLQQVADNEHAKAQIENLLETYINGEELGSLIEIKDFNLSFWEDRLRFISESSSSPELSKLLSHLVKQSILISQKYAVVCTNPPYMSKKYMHSKLKAFIKERFPNYNGDLFSVFMIRNLSYAEDFGYAAYMTPFVWMFIKEYERLRTYIIENKSITSLIQLEYSAYMDATVPICTFVISNSNENTIGDYIRLSDFKGTENQPVKVIEAIKNPDSYYRFSCSSKNFTHIPSWPIAYWVSEKLLKIFSEAERLEKYIDITGSQNITADNDKYLRKHWEVDKGSINKRWQFYTKGGEYRKWYGNIEYVVDWCEEARRFYKVNKTSNLLSPEYWFREGITYNGISVRGFAVREAGKNIYDKGGPTFHLLDESLKYYFLALLNSKVITTIMQVYNPTINYQIQDVKNLPFILSEEKALRNRIDKLCKDCIEISKADWSFKETALEFEQHPFIIFKHPSGSIEDTFLQWKEYCTEQFSSLKEKEEELNRIFIELYGLTGEISPEVLEEDITLAKADLREDMINFISYAVGCILGRFKVSGFHGLPYVPVTKEYIFEDSLTKKFKEFICICFGEDKLKENLEFIGTALGGKKAGNPQNVINKYFLKEFYRDHFRIYKKRPIYWKFTSGHMMTFNALIYMPRLENKVIKSLRLNYAQHMMTKLKEKLAGLSKSRAKKMQLAVEELENYIKLLERYEERTIEIDLDEGVVQNYNKFIDLLQKI